MNKISTGRIEKRKLPKSASISKRPLLRPSIPSPYAGSSQPKVIYVGSKTPFLSAVKRTEKLLQLADKRLVQAGTQSAKNNWRRGPDDEIQAIAEEVEHLKKKKDGNEEVVIKGTGKAISKVMGLAVWFQEREEYVVRLKTGSVGAVDDVRYEEECQQLKDQSGESDRTTAAGIENEQPDEAVAKKKRKSKEGVTRVVKREEDGDEDGKREIRETQIRQVSVLEVYVSLR
ncbi:uncharacterized protein MYCFIDRAFT_30093 [Pseudocercospora fijiensis CIRAD86]|uniref:Uncharacterized protein n=1 Tax=Pseudocercospora fijiensis (strain CIRAD86) TaxID=383855 RepID=M3BC95_PSEFD|nr:uncharacterized protein MYCFIDRAFT_30093 [Pseudocercospora fijiensis CIRAD86]EME86773.1 hypothetical protein MYCFIDRAFT_30093 [Pseudocercospora fijiensis CIRAD86]